MFLEIESSRNSAIPNKSCLHPALLERMCSTFSLTQSSFLSIDNFPSQASESAPKRKSSLLGSAACAKRPQGTGEPATLKRGGGRPRDVLVDELIQSKFQVSAKDRERVQCRLFVMSWSKRSTERVQQHAEFACKNIKKMRDRVLIYLASRSPSWLAQDTKTLWRSRKHSDGPANYSAKPRPNAVSRFKKFVWICLYFAAYPNR